MGVGLAGHRPPLAVPLWYCFENMLDHYRLTFPWLLGSVFSLGMSLFVLGGVEGKPKTPFHFQGACRVCGCEV